MTLNRSKDPYTDFEKEIDIEEFKESVLNCFGSIDEPRMTCNLTYKLEHVFFIILSAMIPGANSINQIYIFAKIKERWNKSLILISKIPSYGVFWWILVRTQPEFLKQLLSEWLDTHPNGLTSKKRMVQLKKHHNGKEQPSMTRSSNLIRKKLLHFKSTGPSF